MRGVNLCHTAPAYTHTHTLSLSLSLTHTHTHTLATADELVVQNRRPSFILIHSRAAEGI